jgi:hypothetical protein
MFPIVFTELSPLLGEMAHPATNASAGKSTAFCLFIVVCIVFPLILTFPIRGAIWIADAHQRDHHEN